MPKPKTETRTQAVRDAVNATSGYEGITGETVAVATQLVADLLIANWIQINDILHTDEDQSVSISVNVSVSAGGQKPQVIAKVGFAQKYKDEAQCFGEDPNQTKLEI